MMVQKVEGCSKLSEISSELQNKYPLSAPDIMVNAPTVLKEEGLEDIEEQV